LISQRFHKWIHIFGKKTSERISTKKVWNHVIKIRKEFVLEKEKMYLLLREEKGKIHEFIKEQWYIRPSKSS